MSFDVDSYLKTTAVEVDNYLKAHLEKLTSSSRVGFQGLIDAMDYSVFGGGKRIRPVLSLATAEALGKPHDQVLRFAAALEFIHTYSLVHDDLPCMDDSDMRRGKPSCHMKFTEATAVLSGDALLTEAFSLLAQGTDQAPEITVEVIGMLARAAGPVGMVGGQFMDIALSGKEITFPELELMEIHKTGELMRVSITGAARLCGASESEYESLKSYGSNIGLAFQIWDDILDAEEGGTDAKLGRPTYPSHLGMQEAKERATDLVEKAVSNLQEFGDKAEALRQIAHFVISRSV
jgi:geranylgeranyl pyrophosphate synthase